MPLSTPRKLRDQIVPKYRHITWKTVANQESKFLKFQCHFSPFGHEDSFYTFFLFFFFEQQIKTRINLSAIWLFFFCWSPNFTSQWLLVSPCTFHLLGSWPGLKLTRKIKLVPVNKSKTPDQQRSCTHSLRNEFKTENTTLRSKPISPEHPAISFLGYLAQCVRLSILNWSLLATNGLEVNVDIEGLFYYGGVCIGV